MVLKRRRAPEIAFEPAKHVNTPMRLIESVNWQKIPSDGPVPPFKAEHCRMLGHVIRCATDADGALDANQETEGIIGTFLDLAEQIEGLHTHGKSGQRYEAVSALQGEDDSGRAVGPPRYLLDADTGEIVIRVSDLLEVARRQVGSLPHGWLDARMGRLGWQRSQLQGYGLPGRDGRRHGPHARCAIYRGPLAAIRDEDAPDA